MKQKQKSANDYGLTQQSVVFPLSLREVFEELDSPQSTTMLDIDACDSLLHDNQW